MAPSKTLLQELSELVQRFVVAYEDSRDPMTGTLAATLSAVAGAAYAGQEVLLQEMGLELTLKGLADLHQRRPPCST